MRPPVPTSTTPQRPSHAVPPLSISQSPESEPRLSAKDRLTAAVPILGLAYAASTASHPPSAVHADASPPRSHRATASSIAPRIEPGQRSPLASSLPDSLDGERLQPAVPEDPGAMGKQRQAMRDRVQALQQELQEATRRGEGMSELRFKAAVLALCSGRLRALEGQVSTVPQIQHVGGETEIIATFGLYVCLCPGIESCRSRKRLAVLSICAQPLSLAAVAEGLQSREQPKGAETHTDWEPMPECTSLVLQGPLQRAHLPPHSQAAYALPTQTQKATPTAHERIQQVQDVLDARATDADNALSSLLQLASRAQSLQHKVQLAQSHQAEPSEARRAARLPDPELRMWQQHQVGAAFASALCSSLPCDHYTIGGSECAKGAATWFSPLHMEANLDANPE